MSTPVKKFKFSFGVHGPRLMMTLLGQDGTGSMTWVLFLNQNTPKKPNKFGQIDM
jgi:hypothetical protein